MKLEFAEHSHSNHLLQALNQQRCKKVCCDVVINVGKRSYAAHQNVLTAVSPFVKELISSNEIQATDELSVTIDMDYMNPSSVEQLLDYIYTGRVVISEQNVEDLLRGAKYFVIPRLRDHCLEFLHLSLNQDNFLQALRIANEQEEVKELLDLVYTYVRDNFFNLAHHRDLKECPYKIFSRLLRDEELHAKNEGQVLLALLKWVNHNKEDRERYFEKLFPCIRLQAISDNLLATISSKDSIIKNYPSCMALIVEVLRARMEKGPQALWQFQRKGALLDAVLLLGGQRADGNFTHGVYAYVIQEDTWIKITDMPYKAAALSAASSGKYIYVSGGTNELNDSLKTAWRYDLDGDSWSKLPELPIGLVFHTMVRCKGAVYTVGGSVAPRKYISTIYRYDDRKEKWTTTGKISVPMDCAEVINRGDKYIYVVTGRCIVNGRTSRVGVVDCFDTSVGEVQQSLTFPIEFKHRPLLSLHGDNLLRLQSHKQSLDINLQKFKAVKYPNNVPLLPDGTKLEVCHAVCRLGDQAFVCGGTSAVEGKQSKEYCLSQAAYLWDPTEGKWKGVASAPEALDSAVCCLAKVPYRYLLEP
uniref:Calicin n=2 Tax=Latimeria chalumnae TaxID=7897 RepID=H3A1A7_LATCH